MTEHTDLIESLDRHRGFLLYTAQGLTEEQARTASTVSALTLAGILKHVADTEEQWVGFAARGAEAFSWAGGGEAAGDAAGEAAGEASADSSGDATGDAQGGGAEGSAGDWSAHDWVDTRFLVTEADTLEALRARVLAVGAATTAFLAEADLDTTHPLPQAPWFEPGAAWSVRRVVLHLIAEISQHAGHADIIREAIDGQHTMG